MTPSVPIPKALSGWRQALMTVSPGRSERYFAQARETRNG
jgi:hypothetical protein